MVLHRVRTDGFPCYPTSVCPAEAGLVPLIHVPGDGAFAAMCLDGACPFYFAFWSL